MTPTPTDRELELKGLVHDLNNVLQWFVGAAVDLSDDPKWASLSDRMMKSVERAQRICRSIDGGGPGATLAEIVREAATVLPESVTLRCDIDPTLRFARNWAWERVFLNLFLNSVRAMPQGGAIEVTATQLEIVVVDDGPGFPLDILPCAFEAGTSTKGTGMGLHVVRTIAAQEGAAVTASNRPRGGAEIRISW